MRLSIAILGMILAACAALAAWAGVNQPTVAEPAPVTGMELLRRYSCHRAETKVIVVRGVEDGFSPAGHEPVSIRPERRTTQAMSWLANSAYDQSQQDRPFTDSLPIPDRITSGLLVIGMRPNGDPGTDTLGIGNLVIAERVLLEGWHFSASLEVARSLPGWRVDGVLNAIELKDMPTKWRAYVEEVKRSGGRPVSVERFRPLIQAIRENGDRWIDVLVQDDTSVDFIGLAVCQEPPRGKGLTLSRGGDLSRQIKGTAYFSCRQSRPENYFCNPYTGDTPCETPLPVACLRPQAAPVPKEMEAVQGRWSWTGGSIAVTEPVPASRFKRIGDVDRLCASRFGPQWRTAGIHDGYTLQGLTGYGQLPKSTNRVWVDIADQPYATCWSR